MNANAKTNTSISAPPTSLKKTRHRVWYYLSKNCDENVGYDANPKQDDLIHAQP